MKKHLLIIPLLLAFMACTNDSPELPGVFSVSKTKQIQFSPGVLKYKASTDTWRFADSQLDFVGKGNENISATYNGWIDLFGFGTSGYNGVMPYETTMNRSDYAPTGDDGITGTEYDWGIHCQIQNGGPKGSWRTPTTDDWYYILYRRKNAANLAAIISIDELTGLLVLPDNWENSTGLDIHFATKSVFYNEDSTVFVKNNFTKAEWKKLEKTGAVFVLKQGFRLGTKYIDNAPNVIYWCTTALYAGDAPWALRITPINVNCMTPNVGTGGYVRLVKDVSVN